MVSRLKSCKLASTVFDSILKHSRRPSSSSSSSIQLFACRTPQLRPIYGTSTESQILVAKSSLTPTRVDSRPPAVSPWSPPVFPPWSPPVSLPRSPRVFPPASRPSVPRLPPEYPPSTPPASPQSHTPRLPSPPTPASSPTQARRTQAPTR